MFSSSLISQTRSYVQSNILIYKLEKSELSKAESKELGNTSQILDITSSLPHFVNLLGL